MLCISLVDDVGFDRFGRRGDCLLDDAALQMRQACQASVNLLAGGVLLKSTDQTPSGGCLACVGWLALQTRWSSRLACSKTLASRQDFSRASPLAPH